MMLHSSVTLNLLVQKRVLLQLMGFSLSVLAIFSITIILFLLTWGNNCMSFTNETDRLALLAFKAHITSDPFHVMDSWNDSFSYCEWPGVICGGRIHPSRVRALRLPSSGLVGSVAPEIGNLSFLREISLYNNSFHGGIPREVSFLSELRYLLLYNNSFEGEIPHNISQCSCLIEFHFGYNNIVGKIVEEIGSLSKLQFFVGHYNRLMGQIPTSFGNLSSLNVISLTSNEINGSIPDALGQLTRLMFLSLAGNKLSGAIPPTLYNLSLLTNFDLASNQGLQGSLPPSLGSSLPSLKWLSIAENQFHGPIPISLSNLSNLEVLLTQYNHLTGKVTINFEGLSKLTRLVLGANHLGSGEADDLKFINTLTNCSSLTLLELDENRFGGWIPNSVANLSTQLIHLQLPRNEIYGDIPMGIENLVSLQILDLSNNLLEGNILTSIGRLQMVGELYLSANRFSGSIPSSLGNMTLLTVLDLSDNRLEGKIPSSIGNFKHLSRLDLSSNDLNGIIPRELFDLSILVNLSLSRNSFFGSLPLEVGGLINLEYLDVSRNMLLGKIPSTLGSCAILEHLFMDHNLFQGSIPSSLSSLGGLQDLDLSLNNLSGFIPKYLGMFKFLQNLNLSWNHLEGEVPTIGVFKNLSAISVIGNDNLCGGIAELQLQTCQTQKSKEKGTSHVLKLIIIICGCVGFLCLLFILVILFRIYQRKKGKKKSTLSLVEGHHFKISYGQLLKATDGFSSANLIGVGSFGSVYKGVINDGIVAVKVLNMRQKGASKSFTAECESLRNIRHHNLVRILTSCSSTDFEGNDFKALVYEFMPNGSLEMWLHPSANGIRKEPRQLNIIQRLCIGIDIATALDYLHHYCGTQVIHCDLKPSNVLLDGDLTAHLGDFGISRILPKTTGRPQNMSSIGIKGSIGYIAPEYGAGADISTHGDVYSFGILLLEMFTGKQPTHEMFKDDFNLHCWAKMVLHDEVMVVIDPLLLPMEESEKAKSTMTDIIELRRCMSNTNRECLNSIIRIGVACSTESPLDRMDIHDVVKELHLIKDIYLGVGNHQF